MACFIHTSIAIDSVRSRMCYQWFYFFFFLFLTLCLLFVFRLLVLDTDSLPQLVLTWAHVYHHKWYLSKAHANTRCSTYRNSESKLGFVAKGLWRKVSNQRYLIVEPYVHYIHYYNTRPTPFQEIYPIYTHLKWGGAKRLLEAEAADVRRFGGN